jgi:hypothetical protein
MMSKAAFTKGQKVTRIANWDGKGTFCFQQAIVESCGAKKMTLKCEETCVMMGNNFRPVAGGVGDYTDCYTFPRMTDDEAAEKCAEIGQIFSEKQKAYFETRKAKDDSPVYWDGEIAKLHEGCSHKFVGANY